MPSAGRVYTLRPDTLLGMEANPPGDEHGAVHGWELLRSCGQAIASQVAPVSKLFVLPLAEALQGTLAVVAHLQLVLREGAERACGIYSLE